MCQLLGMNCNVPTDIGFSFTGFHKRGGETDHHSDGWGIAFYEGRGCRLFIDTQPAVRSPVAELVRTHPIHSLNVIAHIRKATLGQVKLANIDPFVRGTWGRYWTFAHNGTRKAYSPACGDAGARFRPVGGSDSEAAFCGILATPWQRFPDGAPSPAAPYAAVEAAGRRIAAHADFNFLLSDGETVAASAA